MKREKQFVKISIGISALNEENNIRNILKDILSQERARWDLEEILLYCDGCTDTTVARAESIKSRYMKVTDNKQRKGKVYRVNQMLKNFKGDILVIFDADISLKDRNVITNLIKQFEFNSKVMLVGGNSRVYTPHSFFQKAIFTSYYVYFKSRETLRGGHNAFGCTGACLALRKEFAKKVNIPINIISEDTYLYFSCLKMGYKFRHAKDAIVYYKLAGSLKNFLKQIFRTHPESVHLIFKEHFGDMVEKEYKRPIGFYIKAIIEVFSRNPLGTLYMVLLKISCKPFFPIISKKYKLNWFTANSTK